MVQTMFDKYARRDERSPAGAMGRKELSQLSKDSGSARIDSVRSFHTLWAPHLSCLGLYPATITIAVIGRLTYGVSCTYVYASVID
eukprot:COSAG02_NODE_4577_length_5201_cov_1.571737_2_plen_86_part_00